MSSIVHSEPLAEDGRLSAELTARLGKNHAARELIHRWLDDESGYDESVWPLVKRAIEENRGLLTIC